MHTFKSFGIGLGGALLALLLWHGWRDHHDLHALVDLVQRAQSVKQETK